MMMREYLTNPSGLANSDAWSYTTVTEHGYRPGGRSGKALVPLWRPHEHLSETIFLVSVRGIRVPRHLMGSLPILIFMKANIMHNLTTGPAVSCGLRRLLAGLPIAAFLIRHRVVQVSFPCKLGNVIGQRSGCE